MGAGSSSPNPPPPPRVKQDPYPAQSGLSNLSLSPATTAACVKCDIGIDARATTSSVKLTRDFGNISDFECQRMQTDFDAVNAKEMSFHDFFTNLQAGLYSRPVSKNDKGQAFCEQVMFPEEEAAKINSLEDYNANVGKLKTIRIRQVTGGGSFSSGTKAKFRLSIPIKAKYVSQLQKVNNPETKLTGFPLRWETAPGNETATPIFEEITISTMTMYHPSPLRIENVQHDAVLSLNDPSDPTAKTVILIPLRAANTGDESTDFFNKIASKLTTIQSPDPVTGLYPETDIPTGNDWNIKSVFWLGPAGGDNIAVVTDAFYTWMGAGSYNRVELSRSATEIHYGWQPDGAQVRYFMLETPVAISTTDLSFLTRSLPPTPADEAIHKIPDPTVPEVPKVLYKQATGPAAEVGCGGVRERMTNPSQGDILGSLFTRGNMGDILVDEKGTPLSDKESCDPFAANSKKLKENPNFFTPTKLAAYFFNFMIVIGLALGAWVALYLIVNRDYDSKFRDFSSDVGKVLGSLATQASRKLPTAPQETTSPASSAVSTGLSALSNLAPALGKVPKI